MGSTPEGLQIKPDTPTSSVISQTSTLEYARESYNHYSLRVKELYHLLWPPPPKKSRVERLLGKWIEKAMRKKRAAHISTPSKFHIERLRGGSFNRIFGISVNPTSEHREELVSRVPRSDNARPDREFANVGFVSQHSPAPLAKIKAFDFSPKNPVKSPYVVQSAFLIMTYDRKSIHFLP